MSSKKGSHSYPFFALFDYVRGDKSSSLDSS